MSGREGVRLYKALHRTVQRVFRGDRAAMFAARDKVTPGIFCNLLQLVILQIQNNMKGQMKTRLIQLSKRSNIR